ncbi:uncharacterized protein LOC125323444 [Corvus hawaiiensis]|uniref:uncharacterized protein LOC125323444 n=1 Tax=Corvus hawaiiensis TaxID=134902 RepID=UPI0020192033|nr:uncharacterized protein LOC125323444 [Corvus hawaiiensis]
MGEGGGGKAEAAELRGQRDSDLPRPGRAAAPGGLRGSGQPPGRCRTHLEPLPFFFPVSLRSAPAAPSSHPGWSCFHGSSSPWSCEIPNASGKTTPWIEESNPSSRIRNPGNLSLSPVYAWDGKFPRSRRLRRPPEAPEDEEAAPEIPEKVPELQDCAPRDAQGGMAAVAAQGRELDWMIPVGPMPLGIPGFWNTQGEEMPLEVLPGWVMQAGWSFASGAESGKRKTRDRFSRT